MSDDQGAAAGERAVRIPRQATDAEVRAWLRSEGLPTPPPGRVGLRWRQLYRDAMIGTPRGDADLPWAKTKHHEDVRAERRRIRAWAAREGVPVSRRGDIATWVVDMYRASSGVGNENAPLPPQT